MKKTKQVLAILGIILLVSLYFITLICAITANTQTMSMSMPSIFETVVIPVLIWAYTFIYRLIKKNSNGTDNENIQEKKASSLKDKANLDVKK